MMRIRLALLSLAALAVLLTSCASDKPKPVEEKKEAETKAPAEPVDKGIPVRFETSKGNFTIEVHEKWAPIGARRFLDLVADKFFDNACFFRVVPNFVVQFGLAADAAKSKKWNVMLDDDPVNKSNTTGMVTFATAGPNTRTSQVFINLRSNWNLDDQGFAPFGKVTEGMEVVEKLYSGYGERPEQHLIEARGNAYLTAQFPNLDYIKKATVTEP